MSLTRWLQERCPEQNYVRAEQEVAPTNSRLDEFLAQDDIMTDVPHPVPERMNPALLLRHE